MWDEITHPFPNFNGATFEVWERKVISSYTLLIMWLLIRAGIKVRVNQIWQFGEEDLYHIL